MTLEKIKEITLFIAMLMFVNTSCKGSENIIEPIDNTKILGTWYGCPSWVPVYQEYTFNLDSTFEAKNFNYSGTLLSVSYDAYKLKDGGYIVTMFDINPFDPGYPYVMVDYIFKFGSDEEGEYLKMYDYPNYTNCVICRRTKYIIKI